MKLTLSPSFNQQTNSLPVSFQLTFCMNAEDRNASEPPGSEAEDELDRERRRLVLQAVRDRLTPSTDRTGLAKMLNDAGRRLFPHTYTPEHTMRTLRELQRESDADENTSN